MKQYKLLNLIFGWLAFAVSAITYVLTTEASASFWDCGEFIATANKLLVGHPPGAPFFMIVARFFAILAPSPESIAQSINIMSALCSAFTILLLFFSTTHLCRKFFIDPFVKGDGEVDTWRVWAVMGAGLVGSLCYTFSDTFWFSAVEGEVYAMSSLMTALVFWAMLRWEDVADEPGANRWLVLIAYLMGLSIGVHLLNLLTIPALALIYYFKKFDKVTPKGLAITIAISGVVLGGILYGIVPGVVKVASYFDLAFVNGLGFSYNTGVVVYVILLIAALVYGTYYTHVHGKKLLNTVIVCVMVIILGYSSFAMVVIRSMSNPTMDQNSPEDVFALQDYLNREQYGNRPLFYGQTFASPVDDLSSDRQHKPVYAKTKDKSVDRYDIVDYRPDIKYHCNMLFPRMYSQTDPRHVEEYKAWTNYKGRSATYVNSQTGKKETVVIPTFWENLTFFVRYQCNFMYWRYFLWNFAGRQNDIQGHGELTHGNWISGIPFIDNAMLGDQSLLPESLQANKGHNRYFLLPLLLGLLGLWFQLTKCNLEGVKGFWIVFALFFLTGLAIVLYLNQTPLQPRERDYAYAGSFYAFAIWVGMGVLALAHYLQKVFSSKVAAVVASVASLLFVPCVMAQQNWDDHDRSGCTIARDLAYNYLNSCDKDAIIFTNGDNDTFPLWYAQEVEGIRTDVRVCNLSYLQTGWYADQMKRMAYDSKPLPISFTHDQYTGDRDVIYVLPRIDSVMPLQTAIDFIASEDPRTKHIQGYDQRLCYVPFNKVAMDVDADRMKELGIPCNEERIRINFGEHMIKNALLVYDMLNNSKFERPMYYAVTVGGENHFGLERYFQLEGLAYHIVPCTDKYATRAQKEARASKGNPGSVNTDKMYHNIMNVFRWGFYNKPGIYLDENKMRMAGNLRNNLTRLAESLIEQAEWAENHRTGMADEKRGIAYSAGIRNGVLVPLADEQEFEAYKAERLRMADEVMQKLEFEIPDSVIPHSFFSIAMVQVYNRLGQSDNADAICRKYATENMQELQFFLSLSAERQYAAASDIQRAVYIYMHLMREASEELQKEYDSKYGALLDLAEPFFRM